MGSRAHGTRHNLHPPNNDQFLGTSGFCGRMDRDSATPPPPSPFDQDHWSMYFNDSFTLNGAGEV
jgi:hypothetical protein